MTRLLEGVIAEDTTDDRVEVLEAELRELRADLAGARAEAAHARREASRALGALRAQLSPLYRALKAVFGELDAAGVEDAPSATPTTGAASSVANPRTAAVWASWKSKLGGTAAKCIEALLLHGEMSTQQLSIATGLHRTTIPKGIYELNKAGLLNKNGGRFSLKQL